MVELIWPVILLITGVVLVFGRELARLYSLRVNTASTLPAEGLFLLFWSILICAAFNNTAFFVSLNDSPAVAYLV